jgi:23S rRNA (uracil1939-C5)-methyltransferase
VVTINYYVSDVPELHEIALVPLVHKLVAFMPFTLQSPVAAPPPLHVYPVAFDPAPIQVPLTFPKPDPSQSPREIELPKLANTGVVYLIFFIWYPLLLQSIHRRPRLPSPTQSDKLRYMFKPGTVIKLEITDVAAGGAGIAKKDGFPIFVDGAAIGDVVKAEVTFAKSDFAEARIKEVIRFSADREKPRCRHFPSCGGCTLQHLKYEAQVGYKQRIIADALRKGAGIGAAAILPMLACADPWHYRNKVQLPLKKVKREILMGYFMPGTHKVVDMQECWAQEKRLTQIALQIKNYLRQLDISIYDEDRQVGILRHLVIRGSRATGEILVGFVVNAKNLPFEKEIIGMVTSAFKDVVGVVLNINRADTNIVAGDKQKVLWGRDYYVDKLGGFQFKVNFASFYQVNSAQAEVLYGRVLAMADLRKKDVVVDAYAGVGTIAAYLAPHCEIVYGIEEVPEACKDAEENMRLNNIENVRYGQGKLEEIAPEFFKMGIRPNVVVLDPPRAGCTEAAIQSILKFQSPKIVYVSCAPATLARDIKKFMVAGYKLKVVRPVDMFPHTPHVESISLLVR